MAAVRCRRGVPREPAVLDAEPVRPLPEPRIRVVRGRPRGLIADQQLEDHLAREACALAGGLHFHAGGGLAYAGGGKDALALDLDHARAAIPVGAIARFREPAEVRDFDALPVRDLPDC